MGADRAENGHDGIAGKFLDKALVFGHNSGDLVEHACGDVPDLLRVEPLCQCRIAGHIGKKDRYVFSLSGISLGQSAIIDIRAKRLQQFVSVRVVFLRQ